MQAFVNTVISCQLHKKKNRKFLDQMSNCQLVRRTLLHGVNRLKLNKTLSSYCKILD